MTPWHSLVNELDEPEFSALEDNVRKRRSVFESDHMWVLHQSEDQIKKGQAADHGQRAHSAANGEPFSLYHRSGGHCLYATYLALPESIRTMVPALSKTDYCLLRRWTGYQSRCDQRNPLGYSGWRKLFPGDVIGGYAQLNPESATMGEQRALMTGTDACGRLALHHFDGFTSWGVYGPLPYHEMRYLGDVYRSPELVSTSHRMWP